MHGMRAFFEIFVVTLRIDQIYSHTQSLLLCWPSIKFLFVCFVLKKELFSKDGNSWLQGGEVVQGGTRLGGVG